jgi:hypothetical protein
VAVPQEPGRDPDAAEAGADDGDGELLTQS